MRKGHAGPAADDHRDPGFDSDIVIQLFALLSLYATGRVTGWRRWRGLPLAPIDSVASLVAPLSGQNLVSVRDLYKQEATSEYSFSLVFSLSGM